MIPHRHLKNLNDGKIFHVCFVKRTDGTIRNMNARIGVCKDTIGRGHGFDPQTKGLLPVWDMTTGAYRFIPLEGITYLKHHKEVWRA